MTSTLDRATAPPAPALDPALVERLAAIVVAAPGRPRQASYAPFDGSLVGKVPTCAEEDVEEAARPRPAPRPAGPGARRRPGRDRQGAHDTCYGLDASTWTTPAREEQLAVRVQAGTVDVDEGHAAAWASHDAPVGGMKDSGVGRRHGREGILECRESQTVAVQRLLPVGPRKGQSGAAYAATTTLAAEVLAKTPFLR